MNDIVLCESDLAHLNAHLSAHNVESCAVLLAREVSTDRSSRLLVQSMELASEADYAVRSVTQAELKPAFVARVTKTAKRENLAMIFVHTHPGTARPFFSSADDMGEGVLSSFLSKRHSSVQHAAMVISQGGVRARYLAAGSELRVIVIGSERIVLFDPSSSEQRNGSERFDRQTRIFGDELQRVLATMRVAVVGLGGTGSIVAQQLAHLGVMSFVLVDADVVDGSNLNRLVNATPNDVGRPKVDVSADYIARLNPDAEVERIPGDITNTDIARRLLSTDFIFACTDSHGSRSVLQQIAYQYLIPTIDMGVVIAVADEAISHIVGRVQLLAPGQACLTCSHLLDPNQVRFDMMTEYERQQDAYFVGGHQVAPAVITLNGTVSSLAMTMMLAVIVRFPARGRYWLYNAISSNLRVVGATPESNCFICSKAGALARGHSWPLFARSA